MKPKTIVLIVLALTCGLGASYMTSRLLAERGQPEEPEKVEILVAKQNLSVHQIINRPEEMFEMKAVTKENEPPDAIKDFEALKGKKLKTGRNKGDHITAGNLYDKNAGLEVPRGYKAIGVRVNLETTAMGLASLPGKHVDLQLTIGGQNLADHKAMQLLENVLVLAADIETNSEGKLAAPAQIVTFALKQEDILRVNVAMNMGIIRLIIRDPEDTSETKVFSMTGRDILEKNRKPEQPVTPPPVAKQETPPPVEVKAPEQPKGDLKTLTIFDGANVHQRNFRLHPNGDTTDEDSHSFSAPPQPTTPQRVNPPIQPKGGKKNGDV